MLRNYWDGLSQQFLYTLRIEHAHTQIFQRGRRQRCQFCAGPIRHGSEAFLKQSAKDRQFAFLTAFLTALLPPFLTASLQALLFRFNKHRSQDLVIPNI